MFGHFLLQVINQIVDLISRHPQVKIFIWKEYLKSAYCQMNIQANSSLQPEVRVNMNERWYILLSLRLPFGGTSCPPIFLSDVGYHLQYNKRPPAMRWLEKKQSFQNSVILCHQTKKWMTLPPWVQKNSLKSPFCLMTKAILIFTSTNSSE